jgi:hypothetical protein
MEWWLDGSTAAELPGFDADGSAMVLTASTGRTFSGNAVATSDDITVNPADPNVITVNFRGTGALTVA